MVTTFLQKKPSLCVQNLDFYLYDFPILKSESVKYPGLYLDEKIIWEKYIQHLKRHAPWKKT